MNYQVKKQYSRLRLILGDQLNSSHSWYKTKDSDTLYLMAELHQEMHYVTHHIQKICAFFSAMSAFAKALDKAGHHICYLTLNETKGTPELTQLLDKMIDQHKVKSLEYQQPDEYRLSQQLVNYKPVNTQTLCVNSEHFLLKLDELEQYISPEKHHKMEFFYRKMRTHFNVLMDDGKPIGGQWNYDSQNRKKITAKEAKDIVEPLIFSNNVNEIVQRVQEHNIPYIGSIGQTLLWPVTRQQALSLLTYFCQHCLPYFGHYQDAMVANSDHRWSLYHSRLSFALNSKILSPLQVINTAIEAFNQSSHISIAQIEGFVRQILGWREFIRAVYWQNMPSYASKNHFAATRSLPHYFWSGKTNMRCMNFAINQSLEYSYAHHIQRLMITGNFCLLTGIDPKQVDDWYLGIYIDALEWVEMPNTRGMSQFADGGIVATKPYAAGGNYIHKMSDYCKDCHYNIKEKTDETSCPLNSLYWHFMVAHRKELEKNPRIGMIYRNWDKQSDNKQQATLKRAQWCLEHIESL